MISIAVAACIAPLAACGGGEGTEESEDPAASFLAQASDACLDGARETAVDLQLEFGQLDLDAGTGLAQAIRYEEILGAANERLAALEPPPELADAYAEFVDVRNRLNDVRLERIAALETADAKAQAAIGAEIAELDNESFSLAQELGLEGCDNTLPAEQEEEVKATVTEIASTTDGERVCNELLYPEFIEAVFGDRGGVEGCIRFQENPANVSETSFESISGFDGAFANVLYTKVGGSDDGLQINERLFFDDEAGIWRLWDSQEAD